MQKNVDCFKWHSSIKFETIEFLIVFFLCYEKISYLHNSNGLATTKYPFLNVNQNFEKCIHGEKPQTDDRMKKNASEIVINATTA